MPCQIPQIVVVAITTPVHAVVSTMKKIKTIIAGTIVLGHCCIKGAIVSVRSGQYAMSNSVVVTDPSDRWARSTGKTGGGTWKPWEPSVEGATLVMRSSSWSVLGSNSPLTNSSLRTFTWRSWEPCVETATLAMNAC